MKLSRKIELAVITAFIVSVILSFSGFAITCSQVRDDVLRLHVIANSDSQEDQQLKLKVRDAVLLKGADIFDGSVNVQNAIKKITPETDSLTECAEQVIHKNGFNYTVKITVCKDYFETRTYTDDKNKEVTLPAGNYMAVRVIIGSGKGHNWWCVMFPSLCLPAASDKTELEDVMTDDEVRLVTKNPKYEPRFKVVEIYEDIKNKLG